MVLRRFHYDLAFEHYLRDNGIPYLSVDEAKRTLTHTYPPIKLKSFDFVVYSAQAENLLIDVKGRKHTGGPLRSQQNWVTQDDLNSLEKWRGLFGEGFTPVFVFFYWCEESPPDMLFQEVFQHGDRWYVPWAVPLDAYRRCMKPRSPRWRTFSLPAADFETVARPLQEFVG